jgi:hypothetical protein
MHKPQSFIVDLATLNMTNIQSRLIEVRLELFP